MDERSFYSRHNIALFCGANSLILSVTITEWSVKEYLDDDVPPFVLAVATLIFIPDLSTFIYTSHGLV